MNEGYAVVNTTVDSRKLAAELARALIEHRLAACVQIVPVESVYRWKGEIETAEEYLLLAKTRVELAPEVVSYISEHSPYEVPEILVTPVIAGHEPYLRWIREETSRASP